MTSTTEFNLSTMVSKRDVAPIVNVLDSKAHEERHMTLAQCSARHRQCIELHIDAINAFWQSLSVPAEIDSSAIAGWTSLQTDLWLLQRHHMTQPALTLPDVYLSQLWRDALSQSESWVLEHRAAPDNEGELIAFIKEDEGYLVVHRFECEPIYGMHEDSAIDHSGDNWLFEVPHFVSPKQNSSESYHLMRLLVLGRVDMDGDNWVPASVDANMRHYVETFVETTQHLLDQNRIAIKQHSLSAPLPTYPSGFEKEIERLDVLQKWFWQSGRESKELSDERLRIKQSYGEKIQDLRVQQVEIDSQIRLLYCIMEEEELIAIESNLNVVRGQHIEHKSSGEKGIIGQARYGGARLVLSLDGKLEQDVMLRSIEDELRRGEWILGMVQPAT